MQAAPFPLESYPRRTDAPSRRGAPQIILLILAIIDTLNARSNRSCSSRP